MCLSTCQHWSFVHLSSAKLSRRHLLCDQEEQDASAEQSTLVNQAYAVLKSPLKRALYLVRELACAGSCQYAGLLGTQCLRCCG